MITDKILTFISGITILLTFGCNEPNAESRTSEITYTIDKTEPSPMFWDYAISTNMLQTELSLLARQKTPDSQLVTLADSAYQLHSFALSRLRKIAQKYEHIQLPDSLSGADKATIAEFGLLDKEEFKTRYLNYLQQSSNSQLSRYQEALSETEDPALRIWLNTMRNRLRSQQSGYAAIDTVTTGK